MGKETDMDTKTYDLLRHVEFDGYTLKLWDTGTRSFKDNPLGGKAVLAYQMFTPQGVLLFEGADLQMAPSIESDSDAAIRTLLSFLTMSPGDTDDEYFEKYTPEQLEFANGPAEELSLWAWTTMTSRITLQFTDLD